MPGQFLTWRHFGVGAFAAKKYYAFLTGITLELDCKNFKLDDRLNFCRIIGEKAWFFA